MSNEEDISVNSNNSDVVVKDCVDDECSSHSSSSAASDDKDRNPKMVAFELVSSMSKFKRKRTHADWSAKKTKVDGELAIMVQVELQGKSKLIPLEKDELSFGGFVKFVKQAFSIPEGSILAFEYLAGETWFPLEVDIDIKACSFHKNAHGFAYVTAVLANK